MTGCIENETAAVVVAIIQIVCNVFLVTIIWLEVRRDKKGRKQ